MRYCLYKKSITDKEESVGIFHEWGIYTEEYRDGVGQNTIGLVECVHTNKMFMICPTLIQFIQGPDECRKETAKVNSVEHIFSSLT